MAAIMGLGLLVYLLLGFRQVLGISARTVLDVQGSIAPGFEYFVRGVGLGEDFTGRYCERFEGFGYMRSCGLGFRVSPTKARRYKSHTPLQNLSYPYRLTTLNPNPKP